MSLLGKIRTLVGALVHAPFTPEPKKASPETGAEQPPAGRRPGDVSGLQGRQGEAADDSRVADLIAKQRRQGGQ